MTGTIRTTIDGRTYTATQNYHSMQHSGHPGEFRDFPPDWASRAIREAGYGPGDVEGGTVTVVVDGTLVSFGMSKWPDTTIGSADQGGFGFGGLDAKLDIMNYGRTADRSFEIRKDGPGKHTDEAWTTVVDGEVERSETRPFQVTWKNSGNGGFL